MQNVGIRKKSSKSTYVLAALIPPLLVILVWATKGIFPFGNNNLLVSDLGTQYVPFLTEMRRQLLSGQLSIYSFSLGLGDNFFPVAAYYLISPFNLVSLLFRPEQMPVAVELIILLKISAMGLTFTYYLRNAWQQTRQTWLFAVVYALNGFVAMNFYNIMWLDALVWLPLVALGMKNMVTHGKRRLFLFSLTVTIFCNYYLGYMTVLFTGCYLCYLLWRKERTWAASYQVIKIYLKTMVQIVLLACCLLLPTFLGMQKTDKTGIKASWFLPTPEFGVSFFKQMGISGSSYLQRLDHAPSVFVGSLVVILAVLYFFERTRDKREKIAAFLLAGFFFLSLWLRPLNTIWHLMNRPAGFPYRNAIFLIFFTITLAARQWQVHKKFDKASTSLVAGVFASLLVLDILLTRTDIFWIVLSLVGIAIVTVSLICLTEKWRKLVLLLLTPCALAANLYGSMAGMDFGNQVNYEKEYYAAEKAVTITDQKEIPSYRIVGQGSFFKQAYKEEYNGYNDGLLLGYEGLTLYSSTLNKQTRHFFTSMGYYSKNVRRISAVGGTTFSDSLLNVRYYLKATNNGMRTEKNNNALGNGLLTTPAAQKIVYQSHNAFDNQEKVWHTLLPSSKQLFQKTKILAVKQLKGKDYLVKLSTPAAGTLYYAQKYYDENGHEQQQLKKLRKVGNSQVYEFRLGASSQNELTANHLRVLNQHTYSQGITVLQKRKLLLEHRSGSSRLRGHIQTEGNRSTVVFNIPFDTGWSITSNGKKLKTKQALGSFLAVNLPQGAAKITLRYVAPGSLVGFLITIVGISWLGLDWFLARKKEIKRN